MAQRCLIFHHPRWFGLVALGEQKHERLPERHNEAEEEQQCKRKRKANDVEWPEDDVLKRSPQSPGTDRTTTSPLAWWLQIAQFCERFEQVRDHGDQEDGEQQGKQNSGSQLDNEELGRERHRDLAFWSKLRGNLLSHIASAH